MTRWHADWDGVIRGDLDCSVHTRNGIVAGRVRGAPVDGSRYPAVRTHHDGDAVMVVVAGEFDLATANPVRVAITDAILERPPHVIVDLSEVTFMDSSGVHVILWAYTLRRNAESALTIRPGPPNVQRVFELTNLLHYLPFESGD